MAGGQRGPLYFYYGVSAPSKGNSKQYCENCKTQKSVTDETKEMRILKFLCFI